MILLFAVDDGNKYSSQLCPLSHINDNSGMTYPNAYIFGAKEEELPELRKIYNPMHHYETVPGLKRVLDAFIDGTLDDGNTGMFHDLRWSLLNSNGWEPADVYYLLGDFDAYLTIRDYANEVWKIESTKI